MPRNNSNEHGNVFLIVLMGVVLFGALAITMSRGMRSQTTTTLTDREALIAASDILSYAQRLERAVSRIRRKGVSENDISFNSTVVSGYNHSTPQPNSNRVFESEGGKITPLQPVEAWLDSTNSSANQYGTFFFTGNYIVKGIESDTSPGGNELIVMLPYVKRSLCLELNKQLGIANPGGDPPEEEDDNCMTNGNKFTGTYTLACDVGEGLGGKSAACTSYNDKYYFYYALITR